MTRIFQRVISPAAGAYSALQRVPFGNEGLALLLLVGVMELLPGGLNGSILTAGTVGAAPLILNAIGMVLVFRANRFLNFAQVQVGLFAATLFDGLVRGQLLLHTLHNYCGGCVQSYPSFTWRTVNFVLAAVLALAAAGLLSWIVYVGVVRRFSRSPVLVPSIVTVFLAQALNGFQGKMSNLLVKEKDVLSGRALQSVEPPLHHTTTIGGFPVDLPSLCLTILVPFVVVATVLYLRYSSTGVAIRAAADNPQRAATIGVSVTGVTSRIWVIAGLFSGIAALFPAFTGAATLGKSDTPTIPISQLVVLLTILVIARFSSLWMALAAGLVLSVLTTEVQVAYSAQTPLNAMYVVLVGALLLLQRDTSTRASREDFSGLDVTRELRPIPTELRQLPTVRRQVRWAIVLGGLLVLGLPWAISLSQTALLTDSLGLGIIGLSLLVLTGWGGQVSLGQFGFATIGAWVAACSGLPYPLALIVGGLAGAVAAIVVGLPALKLRGLSLAISTIAFSLSAQALFVDDRYLGHLLPASLNLPKVAGIDFGDEHAIYYTTLAVLVLFCFAVMGLRRTRTGRALIALRANEAAAQAFGISSLRTRLVAFSVSGFMAAVAGGMLAFHLGRVAPAAFSPDMSLTVFLYTVLGGLGGIAGPLMGMGFYALVNFFFAANPLVQYLGAGLGAVLLMLVAPGGLAQLAYSGRDAMLRRLAYRLRIPVPSLMGDKGAQLSVGRAVLEENRKAGWRPGEPTPRTYKPVNQWALARRGGVIDAPAKRGASAGVR